MGQLGSTRRASETGALGSLRRGSAETGAAGSPGRAQPRTGTGPVPPGYLSQGVLAQPGRAYRIGGQGALSDEELHHRLAAGLLQVAVVSHGADHLHHGAFHLHGHGSGTDVGAGWRGGSCQQGGGACLLQGHPHSRPSSPPPPPR